MVATTSLFCDRLRGAPDLKAAREVAEKIGTVHHEMTYTIQEGLDAIRDVIYHIETYDVTTIRASTPMFLMGVKSKPWASKWCFLVKEQTKFSVAISTSIKHQTLKSFTRKPYANCWR